MCNMVVFFVDHMAIKFLMKKPGLSGRLARWVFLLREFDYTVEYKPGRMHLQADMSRLTEQVGVEPVDDRLMDDNLFVVMVQPQWYDDIVEFFSTHKISNEWSRKEKKIRVNSRYILVIRSKLFRRDTDGVL